MHFGYITDNQSSKNESAKALKQVRQKLILELWKLPKKL